MFNKCALIAIGAIQIAERAKFLGALAFFGVSAKFEDLHVLQSVAVP